MNGPQAAELVRMDCECFFNVIQDFSADEATFAPAEGMMTVAQQIRHVGSTVTWLRDGAWGDGFRLDFEAMATEIMAPCPLDEAKARARQAFADCATFLETLSADDLLAPMADNPIFGPVPRMAVLRGLCDHTAHHRGSLAVYLRMLGKTPRMPYEMAES